MKRNGFPNNEHQRVIGRTGKPLRLSPQTWACPANLTA